MNVRWLQYKDEDGVDQLRLVTAGGYDRSLMQWKVKKLTPPKIDDEVSEGPGSNVQPAPLASAHGGAHAPPLCQDIRENEGLLMEAKKAWYFKYTGGEWNGDDAMYEKYENIYNGLVGPNAPGAQEALEAKSKATELEDKSGGGGGSDLKSASAVELQGKIKKQEAELAKQQKMIEDLQAKLKAKG